MTRLQGLQAEAKQIENERPIIEDLWNATEEEARAYLPRPPRPQDKLQPVWKALREEITG